MTDHLTDAAIVRSVDGELADGEVDRVEGHLAGCARCRRARDEIEALSRGFSSAVALLDPPASRLTGSTAPRTVRSRARRSSVAPLWLWRAAAVVALLAGLALAIPPVRAWIAERLGLSSERVVERPGDEIAPSATSADDALRIAFLPDGDRFVVRVSAPQAGGRLSLSAAAGDSAVAEIRGAVSDDAALLVLPDGLAIRNRASATADYQVRVPEGMRHVEVRVGERIAWFGAPRLLSGGPVVIGLGAR